MPSRSALRLAPSCAVTEGGWGVNTYYATDPRWYISVYGFVSNKVNSLTREQTITKPLFTPFRIHVDKMHSLDPYDGSDENSQHGGLSGKDWMRARFLSDAIPATSRAAGANAFANDILLGSIRMDTFDDDGCMSNKGLWPSVRKEIEDDATIYKWFHSDFKQVSYFFVHKLFDKFVQGKTR